MLATKLERFGHIMVTEDMDKRPQTFTGKQLQLVPGAGVEPAQKFLSEGF